MVDSTGNVVAKYKYDLWGVQTKESGTKDAEFGYEGYYVHRPSGLYLTWYRQYDPSIARWLSRDPIEEEGGLNLYAYVGNNPVTLKDRYGLSAEKDCIKPCSEEEAKDIAERLGGFIDYDYPGESYAKTFIKFPDSEQAGYYVVLLRLKNLRFNWLLNVNLDHWGGSDWSGQGKNGNWYHITVGYPNQYYRLLLLAGGALPLHLHNMIAAPPWITIHCHGRIHPFSLEHLREWSEQKGLPISF